MGQNREQIPSLEAFHKVNGVGRRHVDGLGRELVDAVHGDEAEFNLPGRNLDLPTIEKTVARLLRPARLLRAEVLIPAELIRLYERAGINGITEEHVDELIACLGDLLPGYDPESPLEAQYSAPTLPPEIHELEGGYVLSVAGSQEVSQERILVKAAVLNFYGLKHPYADAWFDDDRITRAWLARSSGTRSNALMDILKIKLDDNPDLLPVDSVIGGPVIRPNPHRNKDGL